VQRLKMRPAAEWPPHWQPRRKETLMGRITDSKTSIAASHATRAIQEGRTILVYRYDVPATSSGLSGPISGAAEVIETIERAGWRLANMAHDGKQSRNGALVLLFRRP
jgi:hypothetical protein